MSCKNNGLDLQTHSLAIDAKEVFPYKVCCLNITSYKNNKTKLYFNFIQMFDSKLKDLYLYFFKTKYWEESLFTFKNLQKCFFNRICLFGWTTTSYILDFKAPIDITAISIFWGRLHILQFMILFCRETLQVLFKIYVHVHVFIMFFFHTCIKSQFVVVFHSV